MLETGTSESQSGGMAKNMASRLFTAGKFNSLLLIKPFYTATNRSTTTLGMMVIIPPEMLSLKKWRKLTFREKENT